MNSYILVINCGSSSLKYQLIDPQSKNVFAKGLVDRIGFGNSIISHSYYKNQQWNKLQIDENFSEHKKAFEYVAKLLYSGETAIIQDIKEIKAVGHRIVHGGKKYNSAQIITDEVKQEIRNLISLAPLHNPAHLLGIEAGENIFSNSIHYAVFDTSFHSTLPDHAYLYAIPKNYAEENNIRVYGFHGISHEYVYHKAHKYLNKPIKAITAHLGNGASITAINENGHSIDTSMGISPLDGLIMGTRCGNIDPSVIFYMHENLNLSIKDIKDILSRKSGMLGIAGSNDARDVGRKLLSGDSNAELCYKMYSYRIKKYIGSYFAILGGVDSLIFTGGIGENDYIAREMICQGLQGLGIDLDQEKNKNIPQEKEVIEIQSKESKIPILIVKTNEELSIAEHAQKIGI